MAVKQLCVFDHIIRWYYTSIIIFTASVKLLDFHEIKTAVLFLSLLIYDYVINIYVSWIINI